MTNNPNDGVNVVKHKNLRVVHYHLTERVWVLLEHFIQKTSVYSGQNETTESRDLSFLRQNEGSPDRTWEVWETCLESKDPDPKSTQSWR